MTTTTSDHPFSIARRAVRRAMAFQTAEYDLDHKPTGRKVWKQTHSSRTEVEKRLPGLLDEIGVTKRKLRGAVRAQIAAAYASIERFPERPLTVEGRVAKRVLGRAFRLSWQAPA